MPPLAPAILAPAVTAAAAAAVPATSHSNDDVSFEVEIAAAREATEILRVALDIMERKRLVF